jgi:hypothetical protein
MSETTQQEDRPKYGPRGGLALYPGDRFGRLTLISSQRAGKRNRVHWKCKCDCGNTALVEVDRIRSGNTKSCRCLEDENRRRARKHGHCRVGRVRREFGIWSCMIDRCHNPKNPAYFRYGGVGIEVCARWREYVNFFADMGPRPSPSHSIDRIDGTGSYEPGNCRWATKIVQMNNVRTNRRLTAFGETMTFAEWARKSGIPRVTIANRLKGGWAVSRAVSQPSRPIKRTKLP